MKIEAQNQQLAVPEAAKAAKGRKVAEHAPEAQPVSADRVQLSGKVARVAEVGNLEAAQLEKVESIKARIQGGTYQVSSRDVAEKMLARSSRRKD